MWDLQWCIDALTFEVLDAVRAMGKGRRTMNGVELYSAVPGLLCTRKWVSIWVMQHQVILITWRTKFLNLHIIRIECSGTWEIEHAEFGATSKAFHNGDFVLWKIKTLQVHQGLQATYCLDKVVTQVEATKLRQLAQAFDFWDDVAFQVQRL